MFTKTHKVIDWVARMGLDLNNDGVADFRFAETQTNFHGGNLVIQPLAMNHVVQSGYFAAALPAGAAVGPGVKFGGLKAVMEGSFALSGSTGHFGPWVNAKNKFLGLEITINGQSHFGWARISFPTFGVGVLTGYAYETIPGKTILTGATTDDAADVVGTAKPSDVPVWRATQSLGLLARGATGLELWRRDETIV